MSIVYTILEGLGVLALGLAVIFGVVYVLLYVVVASLFRSKPKGE